MAMITRSLLDVGSVGTALTDCLNGTRALAAIFCSISLSCASAGRDAAEYSSTGLPLRPLSFVGRDLISPAACLRKTVLRSQPVSCSTCLREIHAAWLLILRRAPEV